jgi:hypothetical protein
VCAGTIYISTNPGIMTRFTLPVCGKVSTRFVNIESMIGCRGHMCILIMGDNALVSLV